MLREKKKSSVWLRLKANEKVNAMNTPFESKWKQKKSSLICIRKSSESAASAGNLNRWLRTRKKQKFRANKRQQNTFIDFPFHTFHPRGWSFKVL
jgi:hypothetical protein